MNNKISIPSSLQNFLTKWLDFSGRSSQLEHWVSSIFYVLIYSGFYTILSEVFKNKTFSLISLLSSSSSERALANFLSTYQDSKFAIFSLAIYAILSIGLLTVLVVALTSSLSRRLRDIGFATGAIAILVGLLHLLLILGVPYLSAIYAVLVGLLLPVLATDSILTNNNDGFSKFLFRQNPAATAYYAQQGQPGFGFNPNQGQNFNQGPVNNRQAFNQAPVNNGQAFNQAPVNNGQAFNQAPVNNGQAFNQAPVNNGQAFNQAPVNNGQTFNQTPVKKQEQATVKKEEVKKETPKAEKVQPSNPFGDKEFKK